MAATVNQGAQGERALSRLRYEIEYHVTSDRDDDSMFKVRRNGKVFYIRVFPSEFVDSPATTKTYMRYLELLQSGLEVIDGVDGSDEIYDTDVFEWATQPFESFFVELAPDPAPPGARGDIKLTLWDYLNPEVFIINLDVVDEELRPRRLEMERSPYSSCPPVWLDRDFLDDLETWTTLYDPANIVLSYQNPEDALFKPPRKVLIDNEQTACFLKLCDSPRQTENELMAYKKIAAASLDSRLNLCRVHGVVLDEGRFVVGILLTHVDHDNPILSCRVDPDFPAAAVKQRWVDQLDSTLAELHKAGVVWGDAKAENVLVDRDDNAWITDFGGGYTRGWIDEKIAGTVEGDLAGMAKIREYIFQKEGQERWWTGQGIV